MTTLAREQSLHLADLLRRERAALAEFLVALADFDRRRLWLEIGHTALFYFLHREPRAREGARLLSEDRGGAHPALSRDRRAAARRSTLLDQRRRAVEGHHPGESERRPPAVLRAVEARGEGGVSRPPSRPRTAATGGGDGGAGGGRPARRPVRPQRLERRTGFARRGGRSERRAPGRFGSSGRTSSCQRERPRCVVAAAVPSASCASRGRAALRRAPPAPRHGVAPPPREARRRSRRAVALAPGRRRGGDHRGRARSHPEAPREAQRARREAAEGRAAVQALRVRTTTVSRRTAARARPCPRPANRLEPGRRAMPMGSRRRWNLWLHPPGRARPHRAGREGRSVDDR